MKPTHGDLDNLVRHVQGKESKSAERTRIKKNRMDWRDSDSRMYRDLKSHDEKEDRADRKQRKQQLEAYYGGEEQRKKDDRKKKIDSFMDKAMPKRTFDMFGRETNRRTGKLLDVDEQFDSLFDDPLVELWELAEAVLPKPELAEPFPSGYASPNMGQGSVEHPVTQRRNQVDSLIGTGMNPVQAHKEVYGEINTGDIESKAALASTLGRIQDDGNKRAVTIEKEKNSILALDARLEKVQDQVSRDDLRTPMNQQVPDKDQKPVDQTGGQDVLEDVEITDDLSYNDDVAYLQKYGRA